MMPNIPPVWQMGSATRKGKGAEKNKISAAPQRAIASFSAHDPATTCGIRMDSNLPCRLRAGFTHGSKHLAHCGQLVAIFPRDNLSIDVHGQLAVGAIDHLHVDPGLFSKCYRQTGGMTAGRLSNRALPNHNFFHGTFLPGRDSSRIVQTTCQSTRVQEENRRRSPEWRAASTLA
jgi:hypothetical protein